MESDMNCKNRISKLSILHPPKDGKNQESDLSVHQFLHLKRGLPLALLNTVFERANQIIYVKTH